jgi:hypothetical protein
VEHRVSVISLTAVLIALIITASIAAFIDVPSLTAQQIGAGDKGDALDTSIVTPPIWPPLLMPPMVASGAIGGGGGGNGGNGPDPTGGEPTTTGAAQPCDAPCTNTGIEWVGVQSEAVGSMRCRAVRVGLHIGGWGISVGLGSIDCPQYTLYRPGHWGRVTKNCFNATPDGKVARLRHDYRCANSLSPGISTVDCVHSGAPVTEQEYDTFEESSCAAAGGGVTGSQGL